ncbi:hypothetical protein ILYODFUR_037479 [Ilyodon furcidens]|uniref:Uncharacterized protein n=1 Tax=Ilyodon furcidens TaxID=33524 RepID=A0ABV0T6R2_9TELE
MPSPQGHIPTSHTHTVLAPHTAQLQAPLPHPAPHHTVRCDGKAGPPRKANPASAHRRNRADTTEQSAHNGTPDPTPRWVKLTRQEVPGQRQAPGAGIPHHTLRNHTNRPLQR